MLYVLHEHATGYALFHVQEVEELGALLPSVERAITEAALFKTIVKLVAFSPFKSGTNALDNVNSVSEGIVHDDLKLFLETNVPTGKKAKKSGVELGVCDSRISATLQDELGIKCAGGEAVMEIIRGIRVHFSILVKGLTPLGEATAQLGLGHSYSRAKVKFNVHRADNMIIQSIALLDQLDKDVNTFSMRVREWYSYHFPELVKIVNENYMYCRMVKLIGNRKNLSNTDEAFMEKMEEIIMDSAKAKAIVDASKMSMGMDISPIDLINIESFSTRVISLTEYRKSLVTYLHQRMGSVAPNLSSLIGDMVGARLISHAGSLTNLAKYPASTVQILGAEKALFRALKTKGNTPKYGLIFHSTFIGRAGAKNKGRISRFLANKCSIASRIDCFSEQPSNIFGEKLKEQVEERLKFFETGDTPRKNVDVMKEAMTEAEELTNTGVSILEETAEGIGGKKKKKKKKRKSDPEDDRIIALIATDPENLDASPAKRVKVEAEDNSAPEATKKKGKKRKGNLDESMEVMDAEEGVTEVVFADNGNSETKVQKKKKSKTAEHNSIPADNSTVIGGGLTSEKKKRKGKGKINTTTDGVESATADDTMMSVDCEPNKKVKKKKFKVNGSSQSEESVLETGTETLKKTKKKKKKKKKQDGETSILEISSLHADSTLGEEGKAVKLNGSSHDEAEESGKKKLKKKESLDPTAAFEDSINVVAPKKPKKKKKSLNAAKDLSAIGDDSVFEAAVTPKKTKKKRKSLATE